MFKKIFSACILGFLISYITSVTFISEVTLASKSVGSLMDHSVILVLSILAFVLLKMDRICRFGTNYNRFVERHPKFTSHEIDIILITLASALITLVFMDQGQPWFYFWQSEVLRLINFNPFYVMLALCFYLTLPVTLAQSSRFIFEFICILCCFVIYAFFVSGVWALTPMVLTLVSFFLLVSSLIVILPWRKISKILSPVKSLNSLRWNTLFCIELAKNEDYRIEAKTFCSKHWKLLLMLAFSPFIYPFRRFGFFDKKRLDNTEFFEQEILPAMAHSRGQNAQDRAYRYLVGLVMKIRGIEVPAVMSDSEDYPVDLLSRIGFLDRLYCQVATYLESGQQPSFTIGIYGQWGDGKSFIIRKLFEKVRENNRDIICIEIHPWKAFLSGSDKDAVEYFFNEIEQGIAHEVRSFRLRKLMRRYADILAGNISWSMGRFNFKLDNLGSRNAEAILDGIRTELSAENKTLLVVLEDLDRLDKDELVTCFRLLRATDNFGKSVFLLPCDKVNVDRMLLGNDLDKSYSQKFIQLDMHLPPIDTEAIGKFIEIELLKYWCEDQSEVEVSETYIVQACRRVFVNSYFFAVIKNLRHAKRLVNGLKLSYLSLHGEICLEDFIELEIIRQNFPDLYDDMLANSKYYVPDLDIGLAPPKGEKLGDYCWKHIRSFIDKDSYLISNQIAIEGLLKTLFPHLKSHYSLPETRVQRLANPRYFYRYFTNQLSDKEIEDRRAKAIISAYSHQYSLSESRKLAKELQTLLEEELLDNFWYYIRQQASNELTHFFKMNLSMAFILLSEAPENDFVMSDHLRANITNFTYEASQWTDLKLFFKDITEIQDFLLALTLIERCCTMRNPSSYYKRIWKRFVDERKTLGVFPEPDRSFILFAIMEYARDNEDLKCYFLSLLDKNPEERQLFMHCLGFDSHTNKEPYDIGDPYERIVVFMRSAFYRSVMLLAEDNKEVYSDLEKLAVLCPKLEKQGVLEGKPPRPSELE